MQYDQPSWQPDISPFDATPTKTLQEFQHHCDAVRATFRSLAEETMIGRRLSRVVAKKACAVQEEVKSLPTATNPFQMVGQIQGVLIKRSSAAVSQVARGIAVCAEKRR